MNWEAINDSVRSMATEAAIHAPADADAREAYFRQVVGDVYAALATLTNADYPVRKPLAPGETAFASTRTPTVETMERTFGDGRKASASLSRGRDAWDGELWNGPNLVGTIVFHDDVGRNLARRVVRKALNGIVAHSERKYKSRKAREARAKAAKEAAK